MSDGDGRPARWRSSKRAWDVTTVAYTDGACQGNPGPGGWAWAVPGGRFAAGCEARSTNQRMEIAAALDAVRSLPGPLKIDERLDLRRQLLPGPVVGRTGSSGAG